MNTTNTSVRRTPFFLPSARDRQVVDFVGMHGVVTTTQIHRFAFAGLWPNTSKRCIERLLKHGYLHYVGRARSDPNKGGAGAAIYQLAREAWKELGKTKRWRERTYSTHIEHALGVAEVHVQLVEADKAQRLTLLEFGVERKIKGARADAYTCVGSISSNMIVPYYLEVDRGFQTRDVIQGKLQAYVAHYRNASAEDYPRGYPHTVFLAFTPERVRFLREEIQRLKQDDRELFVVRLLWEFP